MKRSLDKEMMDLAGLPARLLEGDLKNLRTINRVLGAARGVLGCLDRYVEKNRMTGFSLLDVGAGSGDLSARIAAWARRKGVSARIVALERDPVAAQMARRLAARWPEISVLRADGFSPPFPLRSFDFVFVSQVLHHFSESEIIVLLKTWAGLARKGIIVSDLIRHPLAYGGIRLLTAFSRNVMTRTDAPLSVRRAFTMAEWRRLFERAHIGEFRLRPFFPFRLFAYFPLKG